MKCKYSTPDPVTVLWQNLDSESTPFQEKMLTSDFDSTSAPVVDHLCFKYEFKL